VRYLENHLTNIATAIRERAVDRTLIVIVAGCGRSDEKDEEEELLSVGDEDGDVVELAELVELAVAVVVAVVLSVEDAVDDIVAEAEADELGVAENVAVDVACGVGRGAVNMYVESVILFPLPSEINELERRVEPSDEQEIRKQYTESD